MLFGLGTKAWTSIAASVVLVSAVIAGVAVATDEGFDPVYAPDWQPGYTFSYDVTGSVSAYADGLEDAGVPGDGISGDFGPFMVKKEVLNTEDYESNGQPLYVSAANFPLSNIQSGDLLEGVGGDPTFLMAERQSDLAPLAVLPNWDCRSDDCPGGAVKVYEDNPLTYLQFPLTEGKKWTQEEELPLPIEELSGLEELAGVTRVHIVGEVTGMETVDLGELGETKAVRVDFAYRPVGLEDLLADIAKQMEDAGMNVDRFNVQIGIHEIVHYSPEYEAIVQQQYLLSILFDVAVSGEIYGHKFSEDVYAELDGSIKAIMTGSNRAISEQLTPVEILQKLGNVDLINDARGLDVNAQRVPYAISLGTSKSAVNVADGEPASFDVGIAGILPDDHHLEYVVKQLDGSEVAWGSVSGNGFVVKFEDPGVYGITVRAIDSEGELVTTSTTRYIEGDYHAVVPAKCSIGLTGYTCAAHGFPVLRGADSAVFEVQEYSGTPSLGQSLYVQGPDAGMSDSDHLKLDADDIERFGYGPWHISYTTVGGLLTEADYIISVDYKAPHPKTIVVEAGGGNSTGGGMLDIMGRMVQSVDGGLQGLDKGEVELDFAGILG